jgi:hypothetical protein
VHEYYKFSHKYVDFYVANINAGCIKTVFCDSPIKVHLNL